VHQTVTTKFCHRYQSDGLLVEEDVPLIADLLSLRASERHPVPNLSPQRRKERTLAALIRQFKGVGVC
jgi:hypothetical protein